MALDLDFNHLPVECQIVRDDFTDGHIGVIEIAQRSLHQDPLLIANLARNASQFCNERTNHDIVCNLNVLVIGPGYFFGMHVVDNEAQL